MPKHCLKIYSHNIYLLYISCLFIYTWYLNSLGCLFFEMVIEHNDCTYTDPLM
jgi:hypothetical protein